MGTEPRFHIPITVGDGIQTNADLDSCAEVDIVSYEFAKKHRLQQAKLTAPLISAINRRSTSTYGVWRIPITMVDSRGTTRSFQRSCVAIDRDPRIEGSPVLLSMTMLRDHRIHLSTWNRKWWFESSPTELLSPHKFTKASRNHAHVFAVVRMPEEVWLPHDDETTQPATTDLPRELLQFYDVFSAERSRTLPSRKDTDHAIDVAPDESPPYGPIYPLSPAELRELRRYLDENIANGRVRPSKSPAGAPILFVPKKDGGLRLCVDYRGLNKVSVKNRYPLPLISEILDRLSGAKYFSKIDVQDAYYRIRIREGDEWKTAFRTRYGHFEYTVMPFGLTNAPATFQNYIHIALRGLLDLFCVAYLDDILVFSGDRESHTRHLHQVLERMRQAELYAKPSKCVFYQNQVEFLGYVVSQEGISMDPRRVNTIVSWEMPRSYHDVQVFLGFCNFYRRFIPNYSRIALPLTDLLKGSVNGKKPGKVQLSLAQRIAFRRLITAFQSASLLRHFDPERRIRVETDASNQGMAGILSQPDDLGLYHPVAFWSRKFAGAEVHYATPDQELFAIVYSFKHWRHYLEGSIHPVEVLSDHANLRTFMKQPKLNGRQARWCMFLSPFDFVIRHRAGKTNPADGPSRRTSSGLGDAPGAELLAPLRERIVTSEGVDPLNAAVDSGEAPLRQAASVEEIKVVDLLASKSQFHPQDEESVDPLGTAVDSGVEAADWAVWEDLGRAQYIPQCEVQAADVMEHVYSSQVGDHLGNLIMRLQTNDQGTQRRKAAVTQGLPGHKGWDVGPEGLVRFKGRLYVPAGANLRRKLLSLYHDDALAGHFGMNRTEELLRRKFHWVNLQDDVAEYVQSCAVCQGAAAPKHRPHGKLESLPIPSRPFSELSMDFITGLPPTIHNGNPVDAILVVVDRFTKWCLFFAVPSTITSVELAELFHSEVELRFGPPDGIVSDRGAIFTSKFWSKLCYHSHVRLRLSTAFHPQTDGQTERMNQTLEHYLRCFIDQEQLTWPKLLKSAEFASNNAVNATTGLSPFMSLLGYSPDFHLRTEDGPLREEVPAATTRVDKLQNLRQKLTDHWQKATETQARHYNQRHKPLTFQRGDLVALSTKNLKLKTPAKKLAPRFIGPFRVLDPVGTQAYRLALPNQYSRIHNVFHVSLLEPWKQRGKRNDNESLPMPELDDDEEWEVEEVKEEQEFDGDLHFLVKWKGWPSEYNQWVPEADMGNAQETVARFRRSRRKAKTKSRS